MRLVDANKPGNPQSSNSAKNMGGVMLNVTLHLSGTAKLQSKLKLGDFKAISLS